jgi:flagellar hook-basal body complex protein FliE
MANPISSIGAMPPIVPAVPAVVPAAGAGASDAFESVLSEAINRVEQYRAKSDTAIERFMTGEDEELHRVALATQQAELSFELFLQAKNKVVQAYQEVMRMQL